MGEEGGLVLLQFTKISHFFKALTCFLHDVNGWLCCRAFNDVWSKPPYIISEY